MPSSPPASAAAEILQRIEQAEQADVVPLFRQQPGKLGGGHAVRRPFQRQLCQNAGSDGGAAAVNNIDILIVCRGNAGALIGPGQLGRDGDDYGALSGLPDGLKFFDKGRRSGLTRRRQHVGLDQPLIKAPAVDGNAINKLFVSEMHRQRNGAHLCAAALRQIDGRVDKNADGFHRVSSCSAAHSRSRLPQINSSAAYILLRCSSVRPMLAASSIEAMRACRAAKISRPRSVRYRGLR